MSLKKAHGVAIAAVAPVFLYAGMVQAQEKGLIWAPAKSSERSYSARLGAKLPIEVPVRAGFEMGMNASEGGAVVDTPIRIWGKMTLLSTNLPGARVARDIGVLMNALTGSSAWSITTTQKRIATANFDFEANRNVSVRYDGAAQQWSGLDVSQSLRLTQSSTGTAFVLTGAGRDSFDEFTSTVAVEQKFGNHLTLTGKLHRGNDDHYRPSINARYNIRW